MWIVALIGSDTFTVEEKFFDKQLLSQKSVFAQDKKGGRKTKDRLINVSIVGLTNEPMHKDSAKEY